MIVAKTRMKKIPKTCKDCSMSIIQGRWNDSYRICSINSKECPMEKKENGNWAYTNPDWCPLMEVEDENKEHQD